MLCKVGQEQEKFTPEKFTPASDHDGSPYLLCLWVSLRSNYVPCMVQGILELSCKEQTCPTGSVKTMVLQEVRCTLGPMQKEKVHRCVQLQNTARSCSRFQAHQSVY